MIVFPKHKPSGHGKGKWHSNACLVRYRKARDLRNRTQKNSRRVSRERAA